MRIKECERYGAPLCESICILRHQVAFHESHLSSSDFSASCKVKISETFLMKNEGKECEDLIVAANVLCSRNSGAIVYMSFHESSCLLTSSLGTSNCLQHDYSYLGLRETSKLSRSFNEFYERKVLIVFSFSLSVFSSRRAWRSSRNLFE